MAGERPMTTAPEVEAAIEAVEAAVKLAPLEYVSPNGSHVYEPANSKRRLKEAARLLRSLPALKRRNALWRKAAKKYRRGGLAVADALELSDEDHARELSALRAEVAALKAALEAER